MTLIAEATRAEVIIQKLEILYSSNKKGTEQSIAKQNNPRKGENNKNMTTKEQKQHIDGLLDLYNDYRRLFQEFGDDEYRHIMNIALGKLRKATEDLYPNHHKKQTKS